MRERQGAGAMRWHGTAWQQKAARNPTKRESWEERSGRRGVEDERASARRSDDGLIAEGGRGEGGFQADRRTDRGPMIGAGDIMEGGRDRHRLAAGAARTGARPGGHRGSSRAVGDQVAQTMDVQRPRPFRQRRDMFDPATGESVGREDPAGKEEPQGSPTPVPRQQESVAEGLAQVTASWTTTTKSKGRPTKGTHSLVIYPTNPPAGKSPVPESRTRGATTECGKCRGDNHSMRENPGSNHEKTRKNTKKIKLSGNS